MKPIAWLPGRALTALLLTCLVQGCAMLSPPVSGPAIPPLSPESRQPEPPNQICLPTCSENLRLALEAWRLKLISAVPPGGAASSSGTR